LVGLSDSSLRLSSVTRFNERSHSFHCHPHVYPQVECQPQSKVLTFARDQSLNPIPDQVLIRLRSKTMVLYFGQILKSVTRLSVKD